MDFLRTKGRKKIRDFVIATSEIIIIRNINTSDKSPYEKLERENKRKNSYKPWGKE